MDNLTIIRKTIDAHRHIRGHIKLVGDSITDREALFNLTQESSRWLPGRLEMVAERQEKLKQNLSALDEGLRNHFAFEEKYLPALLGESLTQALLMEHRKIKKEIDNVKLMVDTGLETMSPEQVVSHQLSIHKAINDMRLLVEEHAQGEEIILRWLEKAFTEKGTRN